MKHDGCCATKTKLLDTMIELLWEHSFSSVSVEDVCKRAGVKKGSFYHFFPSKTDLALAAMDHQWEAKASAMDQIFSAQKSASDRLRGLCQEIIRGQAEKKQQFGKVCGCPFFTVGIEMSTQDEKLRSKTEEMFRRYHRYYASAVRDGIASGEFATADPDTKAGEILALVMGMLLQAKVQNDLGPLHQIEPGLFSILGTGLLQAA